MPTSRRKKLWQLVKPASLRSDRVGFGLQVPRGLRHTGLFLSFLE